jgi:hypothetical protein
LEIVFLPRKSTILADDGSRLRAMWRVRRVVVSDSSSLGTGKSPE